MASDLKEGKSLSETFHLRDSAIVDIVDGWTKPVYMCQYQVNGELALQLLQVSNCPYSVAYSELLDHQIVKYYRNYIAV